eukprot:UC4_evm1s886
MARAKTSASAFRNEIRNAIALSENKNKGFRRWAKYDMPGEAKETSRQLKFISPLVDSSKSLSQPPQEYLEVLLLLTQLNDNGKWPKTSEQRKSVIEGDGDSFSLGAFPPPLAVCKGNAKHPKLLKAVFELERRICNRRGNGSSTVAINRTAKFKPHRDSGAGAGQHISLIVGLGDYWGGEVVVEGQQHDIRYKPVEFDGWSQRHWTLPFVGQRFSL